MYLIAGLGNPGRKYERTKHNVGSDVIDYVTDRHRIPFSGIQFQAECGKGIIAGQKVMLAEPLTYMNLSGEAVAALVGAGYGAALLPDLFPPEELPFARVPLEGAAPVSFGVYYRSRPSSAALREFLRLVGKKGAFPV